jgi:hypothetical protein
VAGLPQLRDVSTVQEAVRKLGVDLPRSFERVGDTSRFLDRLQRVACDSDALRYVADAI